MLVDHPSLSGNDLAQLQRAEIQALKKKVRQRLVVQNDAARLAHKQLMESPGRNASEYLSQEMGRLAAWWEINEMVFGKFETEKVRPKPKLLSFPGGAGSFS